MSTEPVPAVDRLSSRSPGARALQTRERIIEMTAALVREVRYKELTSALVTQRLGLTPPAFYRYFADLDEALLACGETMRRDVGDLAAAVHLGPWQGRRALSAATGVIDAFVEFWGQHRAMHRVFDLLADEGDERFVVLRRGMFEQLTATLAAVTVHDGDRDPAVIAAITVAMLVHVTAREASFVASGISRAKLRRHLAEQVAAAVTGRRSG